MTKMISSKLVLIGLIGLLAACGGDSESPTTSAPVPDGVPSGSQLAQEYYAANPEFFSFKTPADIPTELVWENGSDLPEIG